MCVFVDWVCFGLGKEVADGDPEHGVFPKNSLKKIKSRTWNGSEALNHGWARINANPDPEDEPPRHPSKCRVESAECKMSGMNRKNELDRHRVARVFWR